MARKKKRARPSGGHRQPSRARNTKNRSTSIVRGSWTLRKFKALSEERQNTYFRAKRVIGEIRDGKFPLRAARDNKPTLATVRRYFPDDFIKLGASRRWKISKSDMHVNQVPWLGPNGYEPFLLPGTRAVSRLGTYLNDVKRALRGEVSALDKWDGKKIGGRKLITNLEVLTRLADEGRLDFEDEIQWRS